MNNKLNILRIIALFCIALFINKGSAQNGNIYSTNNGLSSALINQVMQDNRGYIWIATEYGLNKFDGIRFINYRNIPEDSASIKNNYVRTIFQDRDNNVLIGCIDGLMRYDNGTDSFHEIPLYKNGKQVITHIAQMQQMHNGEIWIATSGMGVFRMDSNLKGASFIENIYPDLNHNYQSKIYEDIYHNVWIGSENNGLICYNPSSGDSRLFRYSDIQDNNITAIAEDRYGNLFVGTQKQGLLR